MDLNQFTDAEHKHVIENPEYLNSVEDLLASMESQKNFQNDPSSPLLKLINQSDVECSTFTPRTFCLISETHDQTKPSEPDQFSRFTKFILSTSDRTCKAEMSMLLYPLFIHSYLDMLENNQREAAFAFADKYSSLFLKHPEYSPLMQELLRIKHHTDVSRSQKIRLFRENKYSLKISESTFSTLKSFFTEEINIPFVELIQSKIDLNISDFNEIDDGPEVEQDEDSEDNFANNQQHIDDEFKINYENIPEFRNFLDAKKNIANVPPSPQSLMRWAIHNLEEASCAEINSDGSLMLTGSMNGKILISKLVSPMINDSMTVPINSVPLANPGVEPATVRHMKSTEGMYMHVYGNKGGVSDVSFVPDSKYFLSVSTDNYMRVYSLDTYNCVMKYSAHDMRVWSVDACSKGLALTGSRDTTARLWSLEHLYPLRIFVGHRQDVTCAKFHPKATYIATGSYDKAVRLWSITDGASVRVFPHHDTPVLSVAFSPCGKFLASGGEDGMVLTHELTTGRVISHFYLENNEPVTSLVWSSTGETLVSGSKSGTVQMNGWPSISKIGVLEAVKTVSYRNVMDRILNIQFKKSPPGQPICLGVLKEVEQDTFVIKEKLSTQL